MDYNGKLLLSMLMKNFSRVYRSHGSHWPAATCAQSHTDPINIPIYDAIVQIVNVAISERER